MAGTIPSRQVYDAAFELERRNEYPVLDDIERSTGFAVNRGNMERAARVLACPIKANPPCWQHGRVLYTTAMCYLLEKAPWTEEPVFLDIGTAKGFSALMLRWALNDARLFVRWTAAEAGRVISVDVIDPGAVTYRNSVLEVDGPCGLADYLAEWPEAASIEFHGIASTKYLEKNPNRVHFAFVDGRHKYVPVLSDATMLKHRQAPGDVIVFDDLQIMAVRQAVRDLEGYDVSEIIAKPDERIYAVARKR